MKSMKNKKQKQKQKKMSINIYTIYNNGSFEKIKISLLLKFLRNVFGHLRNLHCQTLMYLGQ